MLFLIRDYLQFNKKMMEKFINQIIEGNCVEVMKQFDDNVIDLTLTSPPYDNLRSYKGYVFPFEEIAQQLYRITKPGGAQQLPLSVQICIFIT